MPSIVRSPPVASSITSRSGPPSAGAARRASSRRIATEPGRSLSSWCARSTVGSRMRKPREPDENTGLKQTGTLGVAELARRRLDLRRAVHAPERRRGQPEPMEQRVRLGLVVRAEDRVGLRDEHRHREVVAMRGEALEVERRLRQDASAPSRSTTRRIASGKPGRSRPGRGGRRHRGGGRRSARTCRCRRGAPRARRSRAGRAGAPPCRAHPRR